MKYLLATLIQGENSERIFVKRKLKEVGKKKKVFTKPIYCPVSAYPPDSNKCEFQSVGQFDKIMGHLIVIVFRVI